MVTTVTGMDSFRSPAPSPEPTRVVVIGGGASGVLTAANLLRAARADSPVEVRVVEPDPIVGPGLAYGAADPHHLLNNTATRMSAYLDDPDHLLRWCVQDGSSAERGAFLPRRTYGRYLASLLGDIAQRPWRRVLHVRGLAVRADHDSDRARVELGCGWTKRADQVVLAVGNPPPHPHPLGAGVLSGSRFVPDPWQPGALDGVTNADRVLLVGTGLTMVDVAISLARRLPGVRMVATSRHGLLPRTHLRQPAPVGRGLRTAGGEQPTLRELVHEVRRQLSEGERAGRDWQGVVDGIREQVGGLWRDLTPADRDRFLRHLARRWEVHRHRMAPSVDEELSGLLSSGRLVLHGGLPETATFTRVVGCTGPQPVCTAGWNPVVDALLADGEVRPDATGLGLDVAADGRVRRGDGSDSGWLSTLGTARRGTDYETTAIPEIREQAYSLAHRLLRLAPVDADQHGSRSVLGGDQGMAAGA